MKKSIFVLALSMSILTMHAQNDRTALEGTRLVTTGLLN